MWVGSAPSSAEPANKQQIPRVHLEASCLAEKRKRKLDLLVFCLFVVLVFLRGWRRLSCQGTIDECKQGWLHSYKLTGSPPSCRIALSTRDGSYRPQPLPHPEVEHPGQVTAHWRGFIKDSVQLNLGFQWLEWGGRRKGRRPDQLSAHIFI